MEVSYIEVQDLALPFHKQYLLFVPEKGLLGASSVGSQYSNPDDLNLRMNIDKKTIEDYEKRMENLCEDSDCFGYKMLGTVNIPDEIVNDLFEIKESYDKIGSYLGKLANEKISKLEELVKSKIKIDKNKKDFRKN